jgi:nicotinate-nucleotide adenylyltransferase
LNIGIFGGTFDPIHNAHLEAATTARDRFELDRVLVIPAANPPHKQGAGASYEHRYRMVELACAGIDRLEPSRLEAGEERSYSIQTIEKIRASIAANDSLYFLIGADAFAEISTWHRWQDVLASVEFVVMTRPSSGYVVPEGARVHALRDLQMPVSSSEIRAALARGERPDDLPDAVYEYIRAHGLYGHGSGSGPAEA